MRLICPSCGAEYEVDDSVIPEAGRDVQCSNCGHAWFQMSATQLRTMAEREAAPEAEPDTSEVWTEEEIDDDAPQAEVASVEEALDATAVLAEASDQAEPEPAVDLATDEASEDADDAPAVEFEDYREIEEPVAGTEADIAAAEAEAEPAPATVAEDAGATAEPRRKTLDDAVMNVLREEADRERRAREAEGSLIETQPDLGVTEVAPIAAAAATVQRLEGEGGAGFAGYHDDGDDAAMSRASRRELLPDIEEINSTLRATSDRGGEAASLDAPETLRRRRSGFRMGFFTAVLIAAILLLIYLLAPVIAEKAPATASVMGSYVSAVDGVRAWLDSTLQGLTASMKGDGS